MKKIIFNANEKYANLFNNFEPAVKSIPEWYKNSPQQMYENAKTILHKNNRSMTNSTYKKCTPFLDALSSGYMIKLSADVEVSINEKTGFPNVEWRSPEREIVGLHSLNQVAGLESTDEFYTTPMKFSNDMSVMVPSGYSVLYTHPLNRIDLPFQCLSGIVDADKYPLPVSFPFFLKKGFTGIIEKGTPIIQLIPFKREDWISETKDYDETESFLSRENFMSVINRSYKTQWWSKKRYQ
jgi:hypothetical protein